MRSKLRMQTLRQEGKDSETVEGNWSLYSTLLRQKQQARHVTRHEGFLSHEVLEGSVHVFLWPSL